MAGPRKFSGRFPLSERDVHHADAGVGTAHRGAAQDALLPTDDLLAVTREFINPAVSRAGLRRHGVSDLRDLVAVQEGEEAVKKTFKDYEPGFLHMDIKYLPRMPDETARPYLFVAIDRPTCGVFMEIYSDQSDCSSTDFLSRLKNVCPIKIVKLITDNGS